MRSSRLAWRLAYEIGERAEQAGIQISSCNPDGLSARSVNCCCLQSVVQVLDPQVYLRSVKKHLSEKQGLPAEHQRLTFAVAAALGKAEDSAPLPGSAEGLLSGLDTWQVPSEKCWKLYLVSPIVALARLRGVLHCAGSGLRQQKVYWEIHSSPSIFSVTAW